MQHKPLYPTLCLQPAINRLIDETERKRRSEGERGGGRGAYVASVANQQDFAPLKPILDLAAWLILPTELVLKGQAFPPQRTLASPIIVEKEEKKALSAIANLYLPRV